MNRFQFIICSIIFYLWGCNVPKPSAYLEKAKIDYYSAIAEQIIAKEFPYIDFKDFSCCKIWNDENNNTHVAYSRDSDREEFKGQLSYCHDNFIRETITVVITESKEMLFVSIKKERKLAECIDLVKPSLSIHQTPVLSGADRARVVK
jgi:hypothetical protein